MPRIAAPSLVSSAPADAVALARALERFAREVTAPLNLSLVMTDTVQLVSDEVTVPQSSARVYVRARQTAAQSIPNAATTTLTGWAEDEDANAAFNASTGEFTAPRAGLYIVSGGAVTVQSAGYLDLRAFVNGTERAHFDVGGTISGVCGSAGAIPLRLASGDVVTLRVYQNSGAAVNTEVSNYNTAIAILEQPSAEHPVAASCWPRYLACNVPGEPGSVTLAKVVQKNGSGYFGPLSVDWLYEERGGVPFVKVRNVAGLPVGTWALTFRIERGS